MSDDLYEQIKILKYDFQECIFQVKECKDSQIDLVIPDDLPSSIPIRNNINIKKNIMLAHT